MEEGSLFQRMKNIFQAEDEKLDDGMQKEAAVLIRNIFRYMDKDAKDIMTHRKNIVAIDGQSRQKWESQRLSGKSVVPTAHSLILPYYPLPSISFSKHYC